MTGVLLAVVLFYFFDEEEDGCDFGYVCVVVEEVFDEVFELDVIVEIIDHAKAVALVVVPE